MAEWDSSTKEQVKKIPLLTENAGPRDTKEKWDARLKQELQALIKYIQMNKDSDTDWFTIQPQDGGKRWTGKCWYVHNYLKYEFDFQFDVPATYPAGQHPHFGFAHALCLGLAPWLAAEVPYLVEAGAIQPKV
ncbi:hypothetical protein Rsub_09442 [Raphidocelis subcapitata]|uniref:Ubiquitin-fold modifier-conjugating enzyme 1 n=1 Tax=Raphidocelis subcapitata TaxID=307507 RepID=A0A2V0PFL5_9CHLO|nr:hypothetical protein Rsub_09442 [Raphidocelis subcapitata]|eukprot:GBF96700.1 hypothetical protein Rsub_09442 [Raphidocelis subcapitata]